MDVKNRVSIVLPSRNEVFLAHTVEDIFAKAASDVEVIAVLDGYVPDPPLKERKGLVIIPKVVAEGMRPALNDGFAIASGEYIAKCDAHIMFSEGFDETLKADCEDDWLVVLRRYSLDAREWKILETGKAPVDYEFLSSPWHHPNEPGLHGVVWTERAKERKDILIDDNMSMQGSFFFMKKDYFWSFGGLQTKGYGTFVQDPQEISLKVMLSGGRFVTNKKGWYAHLHKSSKEKGGFGRGYFIDKLQMQRGIKYSMDFWMNNRWEGRKYDIDWLIEKFSPVPTWPEGWREEWERIKDQYTFNEFEEREMGLGNPEERKVDFFPVAQAQKIEAWKQSKQMNFFDALRQVNDGRKVTKLEWQNPQIFLELKDSKLRIYQNGGYQDLIVSDGDLAGKDWVVL